MAFFKAVAAGLVALSLAMVNIASAQLQLTTVEHLTFPIDFGFESMDVDPVTGHLWMLGNEFPYPVTPHLIEYDPVTETIVSSTAFSIGPGGTLPGYPKSLTISDDTQNLYVGWKYADDDDVFPESGGMLELTRSGQLVNSSILFGNEGEIVALARGPAGELIGVSSGSYNPPIYSIDLDALTIKETLNHAPDTDSYDFAGGDIDPVTGRFVVNVRLADWLGELDSTYGQFLSTASLKQFIPPTTDIVESIAFSPSGDRLYLGGWFGLIAVTRVVPEPSTLAMLLAALPLAYLAYRRRS